MIRCALQHAPTLTRPYAYEEEASGKGRRGRRPLRWDRTVFVCFQSSRRDTFMRHGAIHGETNSCPKAIHARKGNSLAIGCHAAPGRVLCKKSEMFDYPSGFLPRQKATSPDKGRLWVRCEPGGYWQVRCEGGTWKTAPFPGERGCIDIQEWGVFRNGVYSEMDDKDIHFLARP